MIENEAKLQPAPKPSPTTLGSRPKGSEELFREGDLTERWMRETELIRSFRIWGTSSEQKQEAARVSPKQGQSEPEFLEM